MDGAEVFRYPGERHLFSDDSIEEFEPQAAALVVERSLDLLARIDAARGQPARAVGARSPASVAGACNWRSTSTALAPVASIDFLTVAP